MKYSLFAKNNKGSTVAQNKFVSVAGMAFVLWLFNDSLCVGSILFKCCLNITVLDTVYKKGLFFQPDSAVVCVWHNSPEFHFTLDGELEVCP